MPRCPGLAPSRIRRWCARRVPVDAATGPGRDAVPGPAPDDRPAPPSRAAGSGHDTGAAVTCAARHRVPVPPLARWLLGLGITATLTANMARGWSHRSDRAVVAAWPAASLVGSYELLVWLIRASGAPGRKPSAEQHGESTACCGAARSVPAGAIDSGQHSRSDPDPRAQGRRPEDQPARHPAATVSGQQSDGAPGPDADNRAAVAAYRLSAQVGNPLSERKLAQMFGRTSRRWARARITEAQRSPLPIQCSNAPTTSRRSGLAAPFTVRNRRCDWCETLPADYGPRTAVSAARLGARRSPNSADAAWQRSDDHEGFARDPGSAAG